MLYYTLLVAGIFSMGFMLHVLRKTDMGCWVGYLVALFLFVFGGVFFYGAWRVHTHTIYPVSIVIHTPRK